MSLLALVLFAICASIVRAQEAIFIDVSSPAALAGARFLGVRASFGSIPAVASPVSISAVRLVLFFLQR
jgi:hypothetical protein